MLVQILGVNVEFSDLTTYVDSLHRIVCLEREIALWQNPQNVEDGFPGHSQAQKEAKVSEAINSKTASLNYHKAVKQAFFSKYPAEVVVYVDHYASGVQISGKQ